MYAVTHMDFWGAPTVVFNQTTINNGNVDAPSVRPPPAAAAVGHCSQPIGWGRLGAGPVLASTESRH